MRSHLIRTLVAVAVASTLAACGHQRDSMDTASDTTVSSPTAMDTGATPAPAPVSSEMTASTTTPVDATATADTQVGATTSAQTASSPAPATPTASPEQYPTAAPSTMSTYQQPAADAQASTGMAPSVQYDPSGAMKTEIIEGSMGSQMGASGAGATASSADQQSMCDMYGRLKSATSTEERESIMSRILLDMPKDGSSSGLGMVREQCAG